MYRLNDSQELQALKDTPAIVIPDGTSTLFKEGSAFRITQVLGGMFTIETSEGALLRVDGKYAKALGQPVPDDRRKVEADEVEQKGIKNVVMEQLKTCYDPEIPVNIVDLGLIYECEVKPHQNDPKEHFVYIMMTLTAPGCGMGEIMKSDVESKIRDIPLVKEVFVDLVFDPPWESSLMSETARLTLGL